MSRVITIFGQRCFSRSVLRCLHFHVSNMESAFFLFLFSNLSFCIAMGGGRWVMTDLSANLAEKLRFKGKMQNPVFFMMGEEQTYNAVSIGLAPLFWLFGCHGRSSLT
ncbi:hypothetical protein PIB30_029376 [Stylosanthes scabra]|uniref:Uncharacterized protein n=1 Tax=Stylosanthes scabra TaxID=79078 RepID=A0ABU6TAZ8_9FABA|nr:hypothetical protein [Stylosanthes scabra]